eukprot:SAG11_NODE_6577_length_1285_cov_3.741990_1_plen_81_part_00
MPRLPRFLPAALPAGWRGVGPTDRPALAWPSQVGRAEVIAILAELLRQLCALDGAGPPPSWRSLSQTCCERSGLRVNGHR